MSNARFLLQNYSDKSTLYSYLHDYNEIAISNVSVGSVSDVGMLDYTNFTFITDTQGDATTKEESRIITRADVAGNLAGNWFSIHTPTTDPYFYYYVWYNSGATQEPNHGSSPIGIEVLYEANDNANIIAYKTMIAMSAIPDILINTGAWNTLLVENTQNIVKSKVFRTINESDIEIFGQLSYAYDVSAMILARHNFTLFTRYRLRLFSDYAGTASNLLFESNNRLIETGEIGSDLFGWGEFVWGNAAWGGDKAKDPADVEFTPAPNLVYWLDQVISDVKSFKINLSITGSISGTSPLYVNRTDIDCHTAAVDAHSTGLSDDIKFVNRTDIPSNDVIIEANDTGNYDIIPDAIAQNFEIGRIFLGKYIEVPYNIELGHNLSWEEDTKQYRSDGGTLRSNIEVPYRKVNFILSAVPEYRRAELQHGFRNVGMRRDFFMSLFPENANENKNIDYSGVVKLIKAPKYAEFANNYFTSKYVMEEI